jgi:hypothetical protein
MVVINDYAETEEFLSGKLLGVQLDSFRVYSAVLQIDFIADSDIGLRSYWLSATGEVSITDQSCVRRDRSEILSMLYGLIGQRVSAVKVEDGGALTLCIGDKVLVAGMDDQAFEIVWSVTPESPEPYAEHDWSVTYTDESELVMSSKG